MNRKTEQTGPNHHKDNRESVASIREESNPTSDQGALPAQPTLQRMVSAPRTLASHDVLKFQSLMGNRFVSKRMSSDTENQALPVQRKVNQTGLPDRLKSGLESLSGISMDSVRVQYNSPKPAKINALAYTQGNQIHVGPGHERHLPHEGWHVVQQAQGRVKPTLQTKSISLNDNPALEREADVMGAKAADGPGREETRTLMNEAGILSGKALAPPRDLTTQAVTQRAIGLEIESTPDWQAVDTKFNVITGRHVTLLETTTFRLETELSGKLEFVIEPPLHTRHELLEIVEETQDIAKRLDTACSSKGICHDSFALNYIMKEYKISKEEAMKSKHYASLISKDVDLIDWQEIHSEGPQVYITKGPSPFQGGFQATVGVHLSAIPYLLSRLGDLTSSYPTLDKVDNAAQSAEEARINSIGSNVTWYHQLSPSMEGLLNLIFYYIYVGRNPLRNPFPKGLTQVMARTNFAKMFSMTPEAGYFSLYPHDWVKLVVEAGDHIDPEENIFQGTFGDTDMDAQSVDIKIGDWLMGMTGTSKKPGKDMLTQRESGLGILKTMGNMDKTDDLGVKGEENRGVILELRGLDAQSVSYENWHNYAERIADLVDEVHTRTEDPMAAHKSVIEEGQGSKLFWSIFNNEEMAGKDIYAMGVDVLQAPFASQVEGFKKRARSRASKALEDRTGKHQE